MSNEITVKAIRESGIFNHIDLVFAGYVTACLPEKNGEQERGVLFLAAALASCLMQRGHSCCNLKQICGRPFAGNADEEEQSILLPEYEDFRKALISASQYGMAALVPEQEPGARPLVADSQGRLYLNRYYRYELSIAAELLRRSRLTRNQDENWNVLPELPPGKLAGLSKRFAGKTELDYQQAAVFLAHARNFTIITGGPGTGKTTVLTALLAWEIEENPEIRIELCAPTGKAQNRMKESIAAELKHDLLECSAQVKEKLAALHCQTVDSLLHPIQHSPNYRRNRSNPVPADLVVLDEVSMASLSMLGHLIEALSPETRLILIGDKDQLSPVEAGAVLGDMIASGTANAMPPELAAQFERHTGWHFPAANDSRPLSGCIAELKFNYRAKDAPLISEAANRMRSLNTAPEKADEICSWLLTMDNQEFTVCDFAASRKKLTLAVQNFLQPAREVIREAEKGTLAGLKTAFELLDSFKILSPVRQGFHGVENLNRIAMKFLGRRSRFSVGTPLIILDNTPSLKLFNGDIGLVWCSRENPGETDPETVVMFRCIQPDGTHGFRTVRLSELPAHETVYAMTVHKSQGSGFKNVMIVMPPKDVPILTRELLYTAVTRAELSVFLCIGKDILLKSLKTTTVRYSGLPDRLTKNEEK